MANPPADTTHFLLHYEYPMLDQCMSFSILLTFVPPPAQLNQKRKQKVHKHEKHQLFRFSDRHHFDL